MKLILIIRYFTQNIQNIITLTCNQYKKLLKSCFTFFVFCMKCLKLSVHFTLTAHLNSDWALATGLDINV